MRLPDDQTKFSAQFKYVELAKYWEEKNKLVREKNDDRPALFDVNRIQDYINKKGETGVYSSVFQYNGTDLHDSAFMGSMYFDLDANDLEVSKSEAFKLVKHLLQFIPESGVRLYFSGGKGFHVECEALSLGISANDELPRIFRFIAEDLKEKLSLETLDFSVYDKRRMWRVPNSRHQRSGLYKVECMQLRGTDASIDEIKRYAERPRELNLPEMKFDYKANQWFREYTYSFESSLIVKKKQYTPDMLRGFLSNGTSNIKDFSQEKIFDRSRLLNSCSAIKELDRKARAEGFLTHYERLFLCSILTYSEEAVQYLHEILSKCSDYQFEVSHSHIEDWIQRREHEIGGRPFTCQKAREVGIMCSSCETMEPRSKMVRLDNGKFMETEEQSMPSPVRFAYSNKEL